MLSRPHSRAAFPYFSTKSTTFSTKMYCSQNVHYFFKIRSRILSPRVVSYIRRQEVTKKILSFPYSLLMQNPLPGRQNRAADDANIDHTVPPVCFPAARLGGSFLFPPFGAKNRTAFVKLPGFLWFRCNHAQRARCKMASPFMISSLVMVRGGSRRRVSLPAVSTRRPSSMHFCASSLWPMP